MVDKLMRAHVSAICRRELGKLSPVSRVLVLRKLLKTARAEATQPIPVDPRQTELFKDDS